MNRHILFISSVNLTTNPRILKEIKLAARQGYKVSFIGFKLGNWTDKIEQLHIQELQLIVSLYYLDATRTNYTNWLLSSVIEKFNQLIFPFFSGNLKVNSYAHSKRSFMLLNFLEKKFSQKPNFIIAHTLGTLFPTFIFSQKNKIPFAFDVEDYHPGEKIFVDVENEIQRRVFLMKMILPNATYISCASPLIEQEVNAKILNQELHYKSLTINNNFSKKEFLKPSPISTSNKLKLVWFSQNISSGRGLEYILPLLNDFSIEIELTLIGNLNMSFYNEVLCNYQSFIKIEKPLSQTSLHQKLADFDIGLAIEMNEADYNRGIALTNKIIAYYQSGLYILATITKAQEKFLKEHNGHGSYFDFYNNDFIDVFFKILKNKDIIHSNKQKRFEKAVNFNWEKESEKLVSKWDSYLN